MIENTGPRRTRPPLPRRMRLGLAAIGLVAVGGVAGTVASHALRPPIEMAPLHPIAIASLPKSDGLITIKGRVVETYGNTFVIEDNTGRTLVDTGREGDGRMLVTDGIPVTVQGRFEHGIVHASFLVDRAGTVTALEPVGGPPHDRYGPPPPPRAGDKPPANAAQPPLPDVATQAPTADTETPMTR